MCSSDLLAGLLVYNATGGSGSFYGKLLALFAFLSIMAYYIISKKLNKQNLFTYYRFGAYVIAASTIVLVLVPNIYGAIFYGITNAIATPMYANPYQIIYMDAIEKYSRSENLIGRVIARETYLSLGRCFGMFCIVICYLILTETLYLPIAVIFCSLFPIIVYVYSHNYFKSHTHIQYLRKENQFDN